MSNDNLKGEETLLACLLLSAQLGLALAGAEAARRLGNLFPKLAQLSDDDPGNWTKATSF